MGKAWSHTPRWAWLWMVLGVIAVVAVVPVALRHVETPEPSATAGTSSAATAPGDPTQTTTPTPVLAVLGDAFTAGAGANSPDQGFVNLTASQLGWQVQINGQAGTGYTTPGAGVGTAVYRDRVLPVVNGRPTVVLVQGGSNDLVATQQQIQNAAIDVFTSLRTGLPDATIVALGPIATRTAPQSTLLKAQGAISAAAAAVGIAYIDPTGWLDVNNVNLFSQGYLPSQSGHQQIAQLLAPALQAIVTPPPPAPAVPVAPTTP